MPLRRRMGSQSVVGRPRTMTWPAVGIRRRLISLRRVVLPLPLRPRRTRVWPEATEKRISLTILWWTLPLTLYVTFWNRMVGSAFPGAIFAFISVDTRWRRERTSYGTQPPGHRDFHASRQLKPHPTGRRTR